MENKLKIKYPNIASEFVALTHYCRWVPDLNRRETWEEVVTRVISYFKDKDWLEVVPMKVFNKIEEGMKNFSVMPAMRIVATAGKALDSNHIAAFNCSYLPIDSIQSFSELMYILMHGTGVGFSVEKVNISKLSEIKHNTGVKRDDYIIEDSREGWKNALDFGLNTWWNGEDVIFNYDKIRPRGAPLKTMGGTASGHEPLKKLLDDIKALFTKAQGRKLTSLECHDICCMIAENVISGGKRRSAMISFSDLNDNEMRTCKVGNFPSYRYMSNNSAVYKEKPDSAVFMKEWGELALSGTGERGIVVPKFRNGIELRTNPCAEILLRPYSFCNLSEVIIRSDDDIGDLVEKVKTATWLGVIQSTFTNFKNIRKEWKKNCEEERLIGVSLTGQFDNPKILTDEVLKQLKNVVVKTAKHAAKILKINIPAAMTCVKPSGTVSQLVDSASGCHPRYSRYYIRRYRISTADPLFKLLELQGMKWKPETGQLKENCTTAVFEFPAKSPVKAICRNEIDAIKQLEWYLKLQKFWCDHNTSVTIYVKKDEWLKVGSYVYDHWEEITGVSFFPYDDSKFQLAPYEEIDEKTYEKLIKEFPRLDFTRLCDFEKDTGDTTKAHREFACSGDKCSLV